MLPAGGRLMLTVCRLARCAYCSRIAQRIIPPKSTDARFASAPGHSALSDHFDDVFELRGSQIFCMAAIVAAQSRLFHGVAGFMSVRLVVITIQSSCPHPLRRAAADQ